LVNIEFFFDECKSQYRQVFWGFVLLCYTTVISVFKM
jgi:hypothetical protein